MMLIIVENVSKARSMKRPNEEKLHSKEKIEVVIKESMEAIKKKENKTSSPSHSLLIHGIGTVTIV